MEQSIGWEEKEKFTLDLTLMQRSSRFKSVSKNWLLLISDSQFSFNHACQNQPNHSISGLYFCYDYWCSMKQVKSVSLHDNASLPTLAFLNDVGVERDSEIRIRSSCNGLLLCESSQFVWNPNTADLNVNKSYIVCNVTTQKYKLLPQTSQHLSRSYAYLAFDPSKSPHYKVLLVFERIDKFNIYSSESSSWKQIDLTTGPSLWGGGGEEFFGMEQSIGWEEKEKFTLDLTLMQRSSQ
ncbi:hypothetical protein ACSBR1_025896 [Camellia fascicularis]